MKVAREEAFISLDMSTTLIHLNKLPSKIINTHV